MKALSIHQTYFFPYIGYFSVIKNVDIHVFADSLQYRKGSWMNRNRIISTDGEAQYIVVPVKHCDQKTPINKMIIDYDKAWEQDIVNRLFFYKKRAPYYGFVIELLDELFSKKYANLAELNIRSNELVMERLGIKTKTYKLSEINLQNKPVMEPDDWGIFACEHFEGVDTYRNAPLGKTFYDVEKYHDAGLNIEFLQNRLRPYDQKLDSFIPSLSILDAMMFNDTKAINEMLDEFDFI